MFVVGEIFAIPTHREAWLVPQSAEPRHVKSQHSQLRFDKIAIAILEELHPRMAHAVTARPTRHEARVITHGKELTPGPKRKVFAIAALGFLELLRRQPIVLLAELFLVWDGPATE
jgi:hypothetical protein